MSRKKEIIQTLERKAFTKQKVFALTDDYFNQLKLILAKLCEEYRNDLDGEEVKKKVEIGFKSRSKYEAQFKFSGDTLVFHMHTNVFRFDEQHRLWQSSYLREDELRAYCGVINIYNFLSDSLKYNRMNDAGYLIGRIFINKDGHFFLEGKKQLGFVFNRFDQDKLNKENLREIVEACIMFSLDFDLYTPKFERVQMVSVNQILELGNNLKLRTEKRLGFEFNFRNKDTTA